MQIIFTDEQLNRLLHEIDAIVEIEPISDDEVAAIERDYAKDGPVVLSPEREARLCADLADMLREYRRGLSPAAPEPSPYRAGTPTRAALL